VHRRNKRLTPVAQAFKTFLMSDGGALIEQTIGFRPKAAARRFRPSAR
jgi:LysR family transcriptional regulator, low CO2-responsive transcriptional regulator